MYTREELIEAIVENLGGAHERATDISRIRTSLHGRGRLGKSKFLERVAYEKNHDRNYRMIANSYNEGPKSLKMLKRDLGLATSVPRVRK